MPDRTDALWGDAIQEGIDRRTDPIRHIVIHRNTVAMTLEGVAAFFKYDMRWRLFPYHVWIDDEAAEWSDTQCAGFDVITPHDKKRNRKAVGIGANFDFRSKDAPGPLMDVLIRSTARAVVTAREFNKTLGRPDVTPDVVAHHTTCPGQAFNMYDFRHQVCREVRFLEEGGGQVYMPRHF